IASARTTSIAFPPSKFLRGRSELVPTSIGVPRRGDYAVGGGAFSGQFGLQSLRLLFHSHPAQFANAFDEIVRPALVLWRLVRLWLLERHWHERPPRYAFTFSFLSCATAATDGRNPRPHSTSGRWMIARPIKWRGGSCQPRRILSFYRSALLRKGAGVRRNILRRKID